MNTSLNSVTTQQTPHPGSPTVGSLPSRPPLHKRKISFQYVLAGLALLLLLIGGGVAYYLSVQNQELRQQAAGGQVVYVPVNGDGSCPTGYANPGYWPAGGSQLTCYGTGPGDGGGAKCDTPTNTQLCTSGGGYCIPTTQECKPRLPNGDSCSSDGMCQSSSCINGKCGLDVTPQCNTPTNTQLCLSSGKVCEVGTSNCISPKSNGSSCGGDGECESKSCINGKCGLDVTAKCNTPTNSQLCTSGGGACNPTTQNCIVPANKQCYTPENGCSPSVNCANAGGFENQTSQAQCMGNLSCPSGSTEIRSGVDLGACRCGDGRVVEKGGTCDTVPKACAPGLQTCNCADGTKKCADAGMSCTTLCSNQSCITNGGTCTYGSCGAGKTTSSDSCGTGSSLTCCKPTTPATCQSIGGSCVRGGCGGGQSPVGNATCSGREDSCCKAATPPTCSSIGGTCERQSCGSGESQVGSASCSGREDLCCKPTTPQTCAAAGGSCVRGGCNNNTQIQITNATCSGREDFCCKPKTTATPRPTPPGGACIVGGLSCEGGGTCCTGSYCQGVAGSRLCQTPPNANVCPGGGTCGGGQGYIGFHCNNLSNGQCLQNPQTFDSFAAALSYAGTCGQADEVCNGGSNNRNLCGSFTIVSSGCGSNPTPPPSTPPGETPHPTTPPGPVCLNIAMSSRNPVKGNPVTFTCGQVANINHYEFRVKLPDGTIQNVPVDQPKFILLNGDNAGVPNISMPFSILQTGQYKAQCRICTGVNASTCQEYESF